MNKKNTIREDPCVLHGFSMSEQDVVWPVSSLPYVNECGRWAMLSQDYELSNDLIGEHKCLDAAKSCASEYLSGPVNSQNHYSLHKSLFHHKLFKVVQ